MQPDIPDKEKTKYKNDNGFKSLAFLLLPYTFFLTILMLVSVLKIRFEDMPVARFLLPNVRSIPMYLWIFLSVLWLLIWRKLFRRTRERILLFVVHALGFLAVAAVIFTYSLLFPRRLRDTIVIENVEYAVTTYTSEDLMLWVCPENLCYGQIIMSLGSGGSEISLETSNPNILQINTRKNSTCLPLQNLPEKVISRELIMSRDSVDCPPSQ